MIHVLKMFFSPTYRARVHKDINAARELAEREREALFRIFKRSRGRIRKLRPQEDQRRQRNDNDNVIHNVALTGAILSDGASERTSPVSDFGGSSSSGSSDSGSSFGGGSDGGGGF